MRLSFFMVGLCTGFMVDYLIAGNWRWAAVQAVGVGFNFWLGMRHKPVEVK